MDWSLYAGFAVAVAVLIGRGLLRGRSQTAAAEAAQLDEGGDLSHIATALQRTALWTLADGGFEGRIVVGDDTRGGEAISVTAFDLETLRERRGEWAWLPVEPPFRIAGTVSVVVCEIARQLPHLLLKRAGHGDELRDDTAVERATSVMKLVRDGLQLSRSYRADLPPTLAEAPLPGALPPQWRAYGRDPGLLAALLAGGFAATLTRFGRRDLVVELLEGVVVVYPAARDVDGADAFADLTATALALAEGVLAALPQTSPR